MAMMTHITEGESMYPLIPVLKEMGMKLLEEGDFKYLSTTTKIILNGAWIGVVEDPKDIISSLRLKRRNSIIPIFTSIHWDIAKKEIIIFTDAGRPCHPLFYINDNKPSFVTEHDLDTASWDNYVEGFVEPQKNKDLYKNAAIVEYIDTLEAEGSFIALSAEDIKENITTHVEIHPSVILGIMANQMWSKQTSCFSISFKLSKSHR
jgi:DNA-directed RNA polymerase beta subunit